jgi:hypothetical protein
MLHETTSPTKGLGGAPPPGEIFKLAASGFFSNDQPTSGLPLPSFVAPMPSTLAGEYRYILPAIGESENAGGLERRGVDSCEVATPAAEPAELAEATDSTSPAKAETLQRHLWELQSENPDHVFIVRGISRMGFRSTDMLEAHYSTYGKVCRVMVVNSKVPAKVKHTTVVGQHQASRIRPGSLGFVVMGSTDNVARIMAEGSEQTVAGFQIRVQNFVPTSTPVSCPAEVAEENAGNGTTAVEKSGNGTIAVEETCDISPWKSISGQATTCSDESTSAGQEKSDSPRQTSSVTDEQTNSDSTSQKTGSAELRIDALAGTFAKLVHMINAGDVEHLSDEQCAEAVALSSSAQQQLQGLVQSCQNRLRTLDSSDGAPTKKQMFRGHGRNQDQASTGCATGTSSADGPKPLGASNPLKKQTLGLQLEKLQEEDPDRILIARKISGMGFDSVDLLTAHYSKFGSVFKVLVAHSKVKPFQAKGGQARIRPGSLGFVVMGSTESVQAILDVGKEQVVAGHRIWVEPFERAAKYQEKASDAASSKKDVTPTSSSLTSDSLVSSHGGSAGGSEKSSGSREKLENDSTDSQQAEKSESGSGSGAENGASKNMATPTSQ